MDLPQMAGVNKQPSNYYNYQDPYKVTKPLRITSDAAESYRQLRAIGIDITPAFVNQFTNIANAIAQDKAGSAFAMDADVQPPITTPSVITPIQFLQAWLPGLVATATKIRTIDELIGQSSVGDWEDQQVILSEIEGGGDPELYSDGANLQLANWNTNYLSRDILRFQMGINVGLLETARSAKANVASGDQKRKYAQDVLDLLRNEVGFFGYADSNLTNVYGMLNDPNLPAYQSVAGGQWAAEDFQGITTDIINFASGLLNTSGGRVNAQTDKTTLAIALSVYPTLWTTTDFGISVAQWIKDTYNGNMRVVAVPEFDAANAAANVAYLYADRVDDGGMSTDDGAAFVQVVPSRSRTLGVEQRVTSFVEGYSNALAGIFVKREYAIYRATGL